MPVPLHKMLMLNFGIKHTFYYHTTNRSRKTEKEWERPWGDRI